MSCPRAAQWPALVAHRFDPRGQEPAGWDAALDHLPGCPECRRAALAADPTLVFRRLARGSTAGAAAAGRGAEVPPVDIAEMQRAVAAMRTASRIGGGAQPARSARLAASRRWAAAAVLVLATGSTGNGWRELPQVSPAPVVRLAAAGREGALQMPVVDDTDRPADWVHEYPDPDFPIAMVYDEGFDDL